jgi:hypothetical protein
LARISTRYFLLSQSIQKVVRYDFGCFGEASILRKAFPGNIFFLNLPGGGGCD